MYRKTAPYEIVQANQHDTSVLRYGCLLPPVLQKRTKMLKYQIGIMKL